MITDGTFHETYMNCVLNSFFSIDYIIMIVYWICCKIEKILDDSDLKMLRTTNVLKRLYLEFKRRMKKI